MDLLVVYLDVSTILRSVKVSFHSTDFQPIKYSVKSEFTTVIIMEQNDNHYDQAANSGYDTKSWPWLWTWWTKRIKQRTLTEKGFEYTFSLKTKDAELANKKLCSKLT